MPFSEARKICLDYTVTGIETISPIASKPFRFLYTSGVAAERDQTKKPWLLGDYSLMRVSVHHSPIILFPLPSEFLTFAVSALTTT